MRLFILIAALSVLAAVSPAQTFSVLHNFTGDPNGGRPETTMALSGNTLYGTTSELNGARVILFKVNTDGTGFGVVHSSTTPDWAGPKSVILSGNTLYGTTAGGYGSGTVFKVNTDGSNYTILKAFNAYDLPQAGVILGGDTLYGTTSQGGSWGGGSVFKVNTDGAGFAVLYNFPNWPTNNIDGWQPWAELTLNGSTLFGTTSSGGGGNSGTIFKVDTNGSGFTVLYTFSHGNSGTNADGAGPRVPLLLKGDTLYGATAYGGSGGYGTVFKVNTNGSSFVVLHNFPGAPTGPWGGLVLSGNTLYGTAENDENSAQGTVFKVNTDGSGFARLHSFSPPVFDPNLSRDTNADGGLPLAGLVLGGNTLYGAAAIRGVGGNGTVFSLQLQAPVAPVISSVTQTSGALAFTWSANPGSSYQIQFATAAASTNWSNLGAAIIATNSTASVSDPIASDPQRFYRFVLLRP